MKTSEILDMSSDERERKVLELEQELFNLRFQHGAGQLENPQKMKQCKRDIARLKTIINETLRKKNAESQTG
jgi:large subunit ribosomal protein L29